MKWLDYALQRYRIGKAVPYIEPGARVLDVGCDDGALFRALAVSIAEGVGVDPHLDAPQKRGNVELIVGTFPEAVEGRGTFDVITMLAVFEHFTSEEKHRVANACAAHLKPGGRLILTVPSQYVDHILRAVIALRLADGMEVDDHHGFDANETPHYFASAGLHLDRHHRFQLGLNHLFVFRS